MTLAFVQKISSLVTAPSFALPSGGSTAGTLLVATLEQNAATSFTPPSGAWVKGPSVTNGALIAEQWYYPNNPGGLATAGTPVVFTGAGVQGRGALDEFSSAAGTSQMLLASGTNTAGPGTGVTVTAAPGPTTGAAAVANWAAAYSPAIAGTWTSPGGSWGFDESNSNSTTISAAYHTTGITGSSTSLIGAMGACPTSIAGWTDANSGIGPLNCVKLFYNGALPTSIASSTVQGGGSPNDLPAGVVPVLCYKTPDTNLASFVSSVTRPVIMVWLNEAEGQSYTYADFKTIFQRQSTTIRAQNNPLVQVAMVSTGYSYATGVNADATAGRWLVPAAYVDMYLWDGYQHYDNGGTGYAWPSAGLANWPEWLNWVNVAAPKGKPLGIAEYGIDSQMSGAPANDPTCAARTARITADAAYLAGAFGPSGTVSAFPLAMWNYWWTNCSAGQPATDLRHMNQFPLTETGSVTAWKATAAANLSASASYSTATGATGWAATLGVYAETTAPRPSPPVITTTSLPAATAGVAYSQALAATGNAPFTWGLLTGAPPGQPIPIGTLPDGLTLDPAAGLIAGTPTALAATSGFTVIVTDVNGLTATQSLYITVVTGGFPPGPGGAPGHGFPQVIIEAGLAAAAPQVPAGTFLLDDPVYGKLDTGILGDTTTWTDITSYARSGTTTRTSTRVQGPLTAYQAGTGSVVLKNATGIFDPQNATSPFAGALRPMVPFRVRAVYGSVAYALFSGFTDAWGTPGTNWGPNYTETTVTATDGFKVLAGITIPAVPPDGLAGDGEDTGARVTRILNAAGWYTDHRKVDTGDSTVQGTLFGSDALSLLQLVTDTETGELYIDGAGFLVFRHRHATLTDTRSAQVQAILGDAPGTVHGALTELPYLSLTRADDDTQLANDVQATTAGGTLQEAQDLVSQRTYLFPRSYPRTDLILEDDLTTLAWAQWVLQVSLSPVDRFDTVTVTPLRDPGLWPHVLGREVGDLIQVIRRPPGVAAITENVFIRGITHTVDVSSNTWQTQWDLQDASRYTGFLILDDPAGGLLDTGKLAF